MKDMIERFQLAQMNKAIQDRNGKKVKLRWNNATEIRRSLARVNNMVLNGELPAKSANAVYYSAT